MRNYGEDINPGARVEISPHYDLWMQGAQLGIVLSVDGDIALVEHDHPRVKRPKRYPVQDLIRR